MAKYSHIAQFICEEYERRKNKRRDLEREWDEIDRQLRMEPVLSHKEIKKGTLDPKLAWMPEVELPLQAQTLEVLTADARRMEFPDTGLWYKANAEMTDEYLEAHDLTSIISGDKAEVPSHIDQDNINKLVEGAQAHWQRQYDLESHVDQINAESFKYSMGVGRCRAVTKRVFMNTAKGVVKLNQKIPVLFPISVKNTYLDDSASFLLNEGQMLGPMTIFKKTMKLEDLKRASKAGEGWLRQNFKGIEADKNGDIELLEAEGDIIAPKNQSGSTVLPNAIITVLKGKKDSKSFQTVVRYRQREENFSSYIEFPYHSEHIDTPYGSSPLLKGWPIQRAACEALLRVLIAGQLKTLPPMFYDQDDMTLAQQGGPKIYPGAVNGTMGDVTWKYDGDPGALFQIYIGLLQQYSDVTGVNAPRLGAQTVSHTTAFAKDAELNRGVARTVDFVKSSLKGPLSQFLYNSYAIGRKSFEKTALFIDAYGGFVEIDKSHLPENVMFEAYGAGGPQEHQIKMQNKIQGIQEAMALEQFKALQLQGIQPTVNIEEAQKSILRERGWTDVDVIVNADTIDVSIDEQGGIPAAPGKALEVLDEDM